MSTIIKKIIFVLFFTFVGIAEPFAQDDYYYLKDLESEWYVAENDSEKLISYIRSVHGNTSVIHFFLKPERYLRSSIRLSLPEKTGVFIENSLVDFNEKRKTKIYPIDSIYEIYGKDSILFSLYSYKNADNINSVIITENRKLDVLLSENPFLSVKKVNRPIVLEFLKIATILILIIYAILLNNGRKIFTAYHNISNTFSRISTDEFLNRSASLTRMDLIYFISLSVLMSIFYLLIFYHRNYEEAISGIDAISDPLFSWFLLMVILFFWYLVRVFIISVFSDLFQIRELKTVHIYELLRITSFFSLLCFTFLIIGLFVFNMEPDTIGTILIRIIIWFSIFRILIIGFKFLNSSAYKKLFLFTYLCIAEFIPVVIGLKYLLKSSLIQYII